MSSSSLAVTPAFVSNDEPNSISTSSTPLITGLAFLKSSIDDLSDSSLSLYPSAFATTVKLYLPASFMKLVKSYLFVVTTIVWINWSSL